MVRQLFDAYLAEPALLPAEWRANAPAANSPETARLVADYIARDCGHMPHEEAVRDLLRERTQVFEVADVTGAPWIEIDFPIDVLRAAHEVLPLLWPLSTASQ